MSPERESWDAVVVGSGFGGSINALRLAEAGKSVVVLERGRRYRPSDFPRDIRDIRRLFWRFPKKRDFQGLYELHFFRDIAVATASGVGGGSLVYANIHIRPDPVVFEDTRWPADINRRTLDPYYDKVASALSIAPAPSEVKLAKRDAYREAAASDGHDIFDPDQAVAWTDPGTGGARGLPDGGRMRVRVLPRSQEQPRFHVSRPRRVVGGKCAHKVLREPYRTRRRWVPRPFSGPR